MKRTSETKQARFVQEYLIDLNASAAARRAGNKGTDGSIRTIAARLLTKVDIQNEITRAKNERAARVEISADRAVAELAALAFMRTTIIAKVLGDDGTGEADLTDEQRAAIAGIVKICKETPEGQKIHEIKVRFWDKGKALSELCEHLGVFDRTRKTEDNQNEYKSLMATLGKIPDSILHAKIKELSERVKPDATDWKALAGLWPWTGCKSIATPDFDQGACDYHEPSRWNVQVLALIKEARKKSSDQRILTALDIKIFLSRVIRGEINDIDTNDQGQATQSPAKLADRIRAAELLGKVLGMFVEKTDEKHVITIRRGADSAASLQNPGHFAS